jgi:hypothetical protein
VIMRMLENVATNTHNRHDGTAKFVSRCPHCRRLVFFGSALFEVAHAMHRRVTVSLRRAAGVDGQRASPGGSASLSPVGRERKKSAVEREHPKRAATLTMRETIREGSPSSGRDDANK